MSDVYKIGVTLTLNNLMSRALGMVQKELIGTDAAAKRLQKTLAIGLVIGGIDVFALKGLYNAGKEYEMAFARFKGLNLGELMNRQADEFARGSDVIGASATDLMNITRDMTQVMGDPKMAMALTPFFAKLEFANQALFGENGMKFDNNQLRSLEKIIETKGGYKSIAGFEDQANMIEQVYAATGGMVKPSDYMQFIKTAGVAGRLLDNKMFYYTMEPLIQEMSGGRVGTGTMSAYNNLAQGKATVRAAQEMLKVGLIGNKSDVDWDKIGQLKSIKPGALAGFDKFTTNPYEWMKQTLIPALVKSGYTTEQQQINEIGAIFGNRSGSNLFSLMMIQQEKIDKNMRVAEHAMTVPEMIKNARNSPAGAELALDKSWERFKQELGRSVVPIIVPALNSLTNAFRTLGDFIFSHQDFAKNFIKGLVVALGVLFLAMFPSVAIVIGLTSAMMGLEFVFFKLKNWMSSFFDWLSSTMIWRGMKDVGSVMLFNKLPQSELARAATSPPKQGPMRNGMVINMDGRKVGEIVSGHQAAAASVAPSSGNSFDIRQTPQFAGSFGYIGH